MAFAMTDAIHLPDELFAEIDDLLKRGLNLTAWQRSQQVGPLRHWAAGENMRLAARIACGVGANRLSNALDWKNWRAQQDSPRYFLRALSSRLHFKPAVRLLADIEPWLRRLEANDEARGDLLAFKAWALGTLRDFTAAHDALGEALAINPNDSWYHLQNSSILEMEDRYQEALEAAEQGVDLNPHHHSNILQLVDCLIHLGRDDEAVEKLRTKLEHTEQGNLAIRLQTLYSERLDHKNALWCLDMAEKFMPLMADGTRKWLAGRRADFFYMEGNVDESLSWMDQSETGYHKVTSANLRKPGAREKHRKQLDVPFIRQHRMTCAPATLASLAKYWSRNHDHLQIAEAICMEGTPWHKERDWAEANGFLTREFRLTEEILIALIDKEIPFTLTTSWVTSGHLQACIGYDSRLGTVIFRDPTQRHYVEQTLEGLIEANAVYGPRCMLLLPADQVYKIEGVRFPDQELYDANHELEKALEHHDRWAAETAMSTLRALNPDHSLTLSAGLSLAGYLGHHRKRLEIVTRLAEQFPKSEFISFQKLRVLRSIEDHASVRELLHREASKPGCDTTLLAEFGEFLMTDSRQLTLAGYYIRKAGRISRSEGRMVYNLADFHLKSGDFEKAASLRRHASTLSPSNEYYADAYFNGCRMTGKPQQGLDFLRERTRLHGKKNYESWLTLARAHSTLHRNGEALQVLENATDLLPNEGYLKIQAGSMMLTWGEEARRKGLEWMESSQGTVPESFWLRERAAAEALLGNRKTAIRLWQSVLSHQPTAVDAHRALARLIAEEQGKDKALSFLKDAVSKNPQQASLWTLLAEWTDSEDPETERKALTTALELDPDNVWVIRQMASLCFESGDTEQAIRYAREAVDRAPHAPESHGVLAAQLYRSNSKVEAIAALKKALTIRVDYVFALTRLIQWADDFKTAEDHLTFIREEMLRQVSTGECIPAYQNMATTILKPDELLAQLRTFTNARPDLWQTLSARINQALAMDLESEARECATHLRDFFPLLPQAWMEVAKVSRAAGEHSQEVDALRNALDLSPGWDTAIRQLGEALENLARYDEAEIIYQQATIQDPLNGPNHGCLADFLYRNGKKTKAFDHLLSSLRLCQSYAWGWLTAAAWSKQLSREQEVLSLMDETSIRYSHLADWWNIRAQLHLKFNQKDQALSSIRKALELAPSNTDNRDYLISQLSENGLYEEALAACDETGNGILPSKEIRGRRAWVLMESGQSLAALKAMEELLAKERNYAWGWHQLTSWYANRGEWQKSLDSATQWVRLSPEEAVAHGHHGQAAEHQEQNHLAKRSFERAYRLDVSYQYAGRRLFHIQTHNREYNDARQTLARLRHYTPGPWVEASAITLHIAQDKWEEALSIAEGLLKDSSSADPLLWVHQQFQSAGWGRRWKERLQKIVKTTPNANTVCLSAWASMFHEPAEIKKAARTLKKLKVSESARNTAWDLLLRAAQKSSDQHLLGYFIWWNKKRFHSDGQLWNTVGELLLSSGKNRKTVSWFKDWQSRKDDTGAHTLVNLTSSLDKVKGPDHSAPIRENGIARFELTDDNSLFLYAAHAAYLAGEGRISECDSLLEYVDDSRISKYYMGLANLARSVSFLMQGNEENARRTYAAALESLSPSAQNPGVRKYFRAIQRQLSLHLDWAKNSRRKLAKKWGDLPGRDWKSHCWKIGLAAVIVIGVIILSIATSGAFMVILALMGIGKRISK